jgi:hypothetical protein
MRDSCDDVLELGAPARRPRRGRRSRSHGAAIARRGPARHRRRRRAGARNTGAGRDVRAAPRSRRRARPRAMTARRGERARRPWRVRGSNSLAQRRERASCSRSTSATPACGMWDPGAACAGLDHGGGRPREPTLRMARIAAPNLPRVARRGGSSEGADHRGGIHPPRYSVVTHSGPSGSSTPGRRGTT